MSQTRPSKRIRHTSRNAQLRGFRGSVPPKSFPRTCKANQSHRYSMTALPIKTEYAICIVVNIISLAVVAMTPWLTIDEILEIPSAGEHGTDQSWHAAAKSAVSERFTSPKAEAFNPASATNHTGVADLSARAAAPGPHLERSPTSSFRCLCRHSELLRKASFGFKQTFLEDKTSCRSCIHFVKTDKRHRCGLDLPEFMTQDAQDCNNYHQVNHQ